MGKGNISQTSSFNILDIVDRIKRNLRSHGKRINRNKQRTDYSLKELLLIFKNTGRHQLMYKLEIISIVKLYNIFKESQNISYDSPIY